MRGSWTRQCWALLVGLCLVTGPAMPVTAAEAPPAITAAAQQRRLLGAFVLPDGGDTTHEAVSAAVASREELAGRPYDVAGWYHSWDATLPTAREQANADAGRWSMISWAPSDTVEVRDGVWDGHITATADRLAAFGEPVLLRWFWEMDATHNSALVHSPAAFIAAWKRVRTIFRERGADAVEFVWCPTAYGFSDWADQRALDYYPGDAHVDWVCADGFNWAPGRADADWRHVDEIFADFHAWAGGRSVPAMVGEFGVLERNPGDKAAWYRTAAARIPTRLPDITLWMAFDTHRRDDHDGSDYDWRVTSTDSAARGWTDFASSDAFSDVTPTSDGHIRIAGDDRHATSAAWSREAFPHADHAVIARGDDFADALGAAALAVATDGPLLLTATDDLPDVVATELTRLHVTDVHVVGGEAAVSRRVVQQLRDLGITVTRLGGGDRWETSAVVARAAIKAGAVTDGAVVASGRDWPDALVATNLVGSGGAPRAVLLVDVDAIPDATAQILAGQLADAALTIVGGNAAVGSDVERRLAEAHDVERVAGADRWETTVAVADRSVGRGASHARIVVASGHGYADALAAGVAAVALDAVLVLTDPDDLMRAPALRAWLQREAGSITAVMVAGGEAAVTESTATAITNRSR